MLAKTLFVWFAIAAGVAPAFGQFPSGADPQASGSPPGPREGDGRQLFPALGPGRSKPALFEWNSPHSTPVEINRDQIVTDRPDFTEASTTVGLGTTQIEFGYTYISDSDGNAVSRVHSWGEPLFRVGILADWLEFRTAVFPAVSVIDNGAARQTNSGLEDLYLGMKLGLTAQSGWLPEMALVPQMTVPTGSGFFTADHVLPGANLLYGWDVTENWTLGGSTQFNRSVDATGGLYTEWAQSLTVGRSLGENLAGYCECFGFFPDDAADVTPEYYFNGGVTWLIGDNLQWDVRAGCGLNDAAGDFFTGTGLSIRFR